MPRAMINIDKETYNKLTNLEKFQRKTRFVNMLLKLHSSNDKSKHKDEIFKLHEYLFKEDIKLMTNEEKILFKLYRFEGK